MFDYKDKQSGDSVEAFQSFNDMGTHTAAWPPWVLNACVDGTISAVGQETYLKSSGTTTLVEDGDWLVRKSDGTISHVPQKDFPDRYLPFLKGPP